MANLNKIQATLNETPSSDINLLAVNGLEIQQVPISVIKTNSGGGCIVDVEDFPSEPSTSVIYRKWQVKAEWLLGGEIVTDGGMTCEVVNTLPETGNMCYTGTAMYSYYQKADGEVYGYVNDILSQ